jgi:chromate transport protein ChrA
MLALQPSPPVLGALASGGALISLRLFFLKTGALVFSSGLAIVPLLRDSLVAQHHWLTQVQFLDAVAMGLITPGPVVITAAFIGYPAGALVATIAIFTPIYLGVAVPSRWFIRRRDNPQIKAFVTGATAAAGGALCGAVVVLTRQAVTDLATAAIAVVTLTLLLRFQKIPGPWIVAAAGAWESCCTDPHRQARIPADLPLHQPRRRNASPARRPGPLHRRRQGRPAPAPSPLRKAARIDHQGACNEHGPGLRPDVQPRPHPADRRGHHGVRVRRSVLAAAARRMD